MDRNFLKTLEGMKRRPASISRAAWFEAAHHLAECPSGLGYTHMHGHSFLVELTVTGVPDGPNGWVEDLANLKSALDGVRKSLDHAYLNDIEGLEKPSLERLCAWIAAKVQPDLPGLSAVKVSRPSLNESCSLRLD
jgi:6-pyruvoyltetrahydropterin/6-carboxytetrahydropterin synthase